ncbi:MAG: OmpA family protein [Dysgonamonadaceae bacterium]|jgi:outer membrane protein OmpA-like peptidoglycan-associated protein|nr:OmpA family protein [Dysgonamonadaceae bacterium]
MKTNIFKLFTVSLILLLSCSTAQAQFGKRLGKAVENAAKNATVRKAEQKTDEAVSKAIDKATDPDTYKDKDGGESDNRGISTQGKDAPQQGVKAVEMAYAKSDFVPGDEIIFSDDLSNEQMGEFPSQWDLVSGVAEVASVDGQKAIFFAGEAGMVAPLMKNMKNYLPDVFTVEFDLWFNNVEKTKSTGSYQLLFYNANMNERASVQFDSDDVIWRYYTASNERRNGEGKVPETIGWRHISISFNKRAFKVYVDGTRIANIPSMEAPSNLRFVGETWGSSYKFVEYITNVRIAKGAVPLYDRMMTDGKFITYGITFDVGKSTIKPESMGEINRIAKLMQDNPGLKFSVEGHTDSTGNATYNHKLSDERSAAVVAKLVEMGVSKDRLQSAGKGQNSPIADNGTDEGRAKNRRVEFIKIN